MTLTPNSKDDRDNEPTYSVYAGNGHMHIASGCSKEEADEILKKFEIKMSRAGVAVPRGYTEKEEP